MEWQVVAKSHLSFYDFLLKRIRVSYVPLTDDFDKAYLITADDKINVDLKESKEKSSNVYTDSAFIIKDTRSIFPMNTQVATKWLVYRNKMFGVELQGEGSAVQINRIDMAVAEV